MKMKYPSIGAAVVLPAILVMSPLDAFSGAPKKKQPTAAEVTAYQKKLFKRLDQDRNKRLTEKEFVVAVLYEDFSNQDANKDGRLTKAEFLKNAPKLTGAKEWKMMDPDGKGSIAFSDVFKNRIAVDEMKKSFKKLDKKGRGYVTLEEVLKSGS